MNEYYLLLTPMLMLIIVGLVGFVGCGFEAGSYTEPPPFAGPQNVRIIPDADGLAELSWDPVADATSYTVKHGTVSGDHPDVHPDLASTVYHDADLTKATTYFFVVTAMKTWQESEPSYETRVFTAASLIQPAMFGTQQQTLDGWVGMGFVTTQQLTVHRLGRFFVDNKLTMTIKLVTAATRTDVPGGTCSVVFDDVENDGFAYGSLPAPIMLAANTEYYLLCQAIPGERYFDAINSTVSATSAVSRVFPVYADAADTYISNLDGHIYGPVNLKYTI